MIKTMPLLSLALATAMLAGAPASAAGDDTVRVRVNRAPDTTAEVRQVRARLVDAALDACGAGAGSLSTVRLAIARGACYRDNYAQASAQVRWPSDQRDVQVAPN